MNNEMLDKNSLCKRNDNTFRWIINFVYMKKKCLITKAFYIFRIFQNRLNFIIYMASTICVKEQ